MHSTVCTVIDLFMCVCHILLINYYYYYYIAYMYMLQIRKLKLKSFLLPARIAHDTSKNLVIVDVSFDGIVP